MQDQDHELDLDQEQEQDDELEFDGDEEAIPARRQTTQALDELTAFVEYMASNLVDDPSQLQIIPENFGSAVHIKLVVPEEEMGKVIGRQGRIARAMRTLLTIAAARRGLRASLDIDS